jgi:hypothetical protein
MKTYTPRTARISTATRANAWNKSSRSHSNATHSRCFKRTVCVYSSAAESLFSPQIIWTRWPLAHFDVTFKFRIITKDIHTHIHTHTLLHNACLRNNDLLLYRMDRRRCNMSLTCIRRFPTVTRYKAHSTTFQQQTAFDFGWNYDLKNQLTSSKNQIVQFIRKRQVIQTSNINIK